MKTRIKSFAVAAMMIAAVAAHAQQRTIIIGTGGTGGPYFPLGRAMASALSKAMPELQAAADVTGGSFDNLKLIQSGRSEIGIAMADVALEALNGDDRFKGVKVPVTTLMLLFPNRMHVVTVEGTGVDKLSDIKGKRVSTGSPGSVTEVMAFRMIEAMGFDRDKDFKRERFSVADSVAAIKDKKIDVFFWVGALPTPTVADLAAAPGMKIKLIDHADIVEAMNKKYGNVYAPGVIAAGTYPGQAADSKVVVVWNLLVAAEKTTDADAYAIVKALIEKKSELVAATREAESMSVENQAKANSPVPWHPGAMKFFTEKGAKMER